MKTLGFKLILISMALSTFACQAESLNEAVQTSFISNPKAILPLSAGANGDYSKSIQDANASIIYTSLAVSSLNTLKKSSEAKDLALAAIEHYFEIILREKILSQAEANLVWHNKIYNHMSSSEKKLSEVQLKKIQAFANRAESAKLKAIKDLELAKKSYAQVIGHWPMKLIWPRTPTNNDLPASVGEAIEQALIEFNYSNSDSTKYSHAYNSYYLKLNSSGNLRDNFEQIRLEKKPNYSKQSIISLSSAVRTSWDAWTVSGLELITAKKALIKATEVKMEKEKAAYGNPNYLMQSLDAQAKFFASQLKYLRIETKEIVARYNILNQSGRLLSFLNTKVTNSKSKELQTSKAASLLLEMDKMPYIYPDYKSLYSAEVANDLNSSLGLDFREKNQKSISSLSWYISAGTFKNKANALAFMNRLTSLGFMSLMRVETKGTSVLIGPYEFRSYATKSLGRLKEIAHIHGALLELNTA